MSRVLQLLLALALFIGVGFVTRCYYQQWMETVIRDASDARNKEAAKWKPVNGNFGDVKFNQPISTMPKVDLSRLPAKSTRK